MHTLPGWISCLKEVWNVIHETVGDKQKSRSGNSSEVVEPWDDMLYRTNCAVKTEGGHAYVTDIHQATEIVSHECQKKQMSIEDVIEAIFADRINKAAGATHLSSLEASQDSQTSIDSRAKGGSSNILQALKSEVLRARLSSHQLCLRGGFPLIITTNWDSFFETVAAYSPDGLEGDNQCIRDARGRSIRVRYRQDVAQIFGEMKRATEYDSAPLLLKLHGDWTEKGRKEFVLGHSSYRSMKKSNKASRDLLQYVATQHSFLFYGTSLSDDDLLSVLDDTLESFGSSTGPHFYLTADDLSEERMRFLNNHYNVQTIRFSGACKWHALGLEFGKVCGAARTFDKQIALQSMSFEVGKLIATKLTLCSKHLPRAVLEDVSDSQFKSVAISVPLTPLTGDFQSCRNRAGRQMSAFSRFSNSCANAIRNQKTGFSRLSENWRALLLENIEKEDLACRGSFFIVMADAESEDNASAAEVKHNQSIQRRLADLNASIREACIHFLLAAVRHECKSHIRREAAENRNGILASAKKMFGLSEQDIATHSTTQDSNNACKTTESTAKIKVILPLLGTGLFQLDERLALRTMLSSIMSTLPRIEKLCVDEFLEAGSKMRPELSIEICMPVSGQNSTIMRECAIGRFPVASILAVAPLLSVRAIVVDENGEVTRTQQILVDMSWEWRTLRLAVGLDPDKCTQVVGSRKVWAPHEILTDSDFIVEGSTIEICDVVSNKESKTAMQSGEDL